MADQVSNSGTSLDHETGCFNIFDAISNDEVSVAEFDVSLRNYETSTGVEEPYSMEDVVEQWDHILETMPEHEFELTEVFSDTSVATISDPLVNTTRSRSPPRMPAYQKPDSSCENQSQQKFGIGTCQVEEGRKDSPLLGNCGEPVDVE
ncbi:unnamed protein product [Orchesella dallaii]|uniref:Uncharacterized protein n=1 Tax=Orchesella dallaii TaxID=48710 RepID=A0ABP1R633_9HEXA